LRVVVVVVVMVITARVAAAVIVVCNTEFTIYGVESKKIIRNGKFIVRRMDFFDWV